MVVSDEESLGRVGLMVSVSPKAREVIDRVKSETGVTKQEAVGRVLEWFSSQPPAFRSAVITRLTDPVEHLVQARLSELSDKGQMPLSFEQAAAMVQRLVEHMATMQKAMAREIGDQQSKVKRKG